MDKAAIYCRLSKEDMDKLNKGDDSESIKNQKMLLENYAKEQGFEVTEIYADEDYSGMDQNRPSFQRLIEDAQKGLFQVILCKSQSRFTRDMELAERYINGLFPLLGIRFIGVVDFVDTSEKGNKKARQIHALVNEWYIEDLSENIRQVFKNKMLAGQFLGSFAPYGYEKSPSDKYRLVTDGEAAETVKTIYRLYLAGSSLRAICLQLEREGILPPGEYKKAKGLSYKNKRSEEKEKGKWSTSTVKRILADEVYTGTLVQGKERKISYKSKKRTAVPRESWIRIPDCHEAVISREDFEKVRTLSDGKRRCTGRNGRVYSLSGKVFCGLCGTPLIRSGEKTGCGSYLRCSTAGKSRRTLCTGCNVKYEALEKTVLYALKKKKENDVMVCLIIPRNSAGKELEDESVLSFDEAQKKIKRIEVGKKEKNGQEIRIFWREVAGKD